MQYEGLASSWDFSFLGLSFIPKHTLKVAPPDTIALGIIKSPQMVFGRGVSKHSLHRDFILPQTERGLLGRAGLGHPTHHAQMPFPHFSNWFSFYTIVMFPILRKYLHQYVGGENHLLVPGCSVSLDPK